MSSFRFLRDDNNGIIEIIVDKIITLRVYSKNKAHVNSIYLSIDEWKKINEIINEML